MGLFLRLFPQEQLTWLWEQIGVSPSVLHMVGKNYVSEHLANPGCGSGQEQRQTRGGLRTVGRIKREGLAGPGRVSGAAQVFAVFPAAITRLRFLYAAQADLANRFIGTTALPIRCVVLSGLFA